LQTPEKKKIFEDMLDHNSSKVWTQVENKMYVQQALLEYFLLK
tara:strand:- start:1392 stop:1520 length:129 start_codon:yes stop_codon:yes gene_type:complete